MKTKNILVASLGLLLCGCGNNNFNGQTAEVAIPVTVLELSNGDIQKYSSTTGTLIPIGEVEVKTDIQGRYIPQINPNTKAPYKIGDKINKGDVIARIEDKEYENNTAINTKRLDLEIAKGELDKLEILNKKGGTTMTEIRNAEVKITNSEYSYENAQIALDKMEIKAPISGVIVDMENCTAGAPIDASKVVMKIMDFSKMLLTVSLSESTMNSVKVGQVVYITHYSLPGDTINATVNQLSPAIDKETRTYKGVVSVDNNAMKLRPGMFVKTDIVVDNSTGALIIPKRAIQQNNGATRVFIVDGNTAKVRNVVLGLENKDRVEIKKGLAVGDKLVTDGHETLRDNNKVKIQK